MGSILHLSIKVYHFYHSVSSINKHWSSLQGKLILPFGRCVFKDNHYLYLFEFKAITTR